MWKDELIEVVKNWVIDNSKSIPKWSNTIAVRYDDKKYLIGDELPNSYSKFADTEDQELSGTSAWIVGERGDDEDDFNSREVDTYLWGKHESPYKHANIIIGVNQLEDAEEYGEVILHQSEVVYKLF